jgi:hypothetical protein
MQYMQDFRGRKQQFCGVKSMWESNIVFAHLMTFYHVCKLHNIEW